MVHTWAAVNPDLSCIGFVRIYSDTIIRKKYLAGTEKELFQALSEGLLYQADLDLNFCHSLCDAKQGSWPRYPFKNFHLVFPVQFSI